MRLLYIYIVILIAVTPSIELKSQNLNSPIVPAKDKIPGYIGLIIGTGQNFQSGEYYVDCAECKFENGVNTGFNIGLSYDRKLIDGLKYGIAVLYDYSGIKNSFLETEIIAVELKNSGIKENLPVQFRHTSEVGFSLITAEPYFKYEVTDFMFFKLGFGAGLVFSSSIKHDKELLQHKATLSSGATVDIHIEGQPDYVYKVNIQDSQVSQVNNLQLYLMPAIGFKLNFSETTFLKPFFQYNLPLSNISEYGVGYKINEWRILLELGFKIH